MSFTRFHDDPLRIQKQLQEMTAIGRYQLNSPGPGPSVPFIEDPQIRLQQWGANLHNKTTDLESDLIGINRKLTHGYQEYKVNTPDSKIMNFSKISDPITDESRATHPAWMFRDLEQSRWGFQFYDAQTTVEIPFQNNVSSRIAEKDNYDGQT